MREPLDDDEVEQRFAELTRSWDVASAETSTDVVAQNDPPSDADPSPPTDPVTDAPLSRPSTPGLNVTFDYPVWRGPTGASALDEDATQDETAHDDDGFEPGPVDLPPSEDLHYWAALAGLVLGPACVLYAALGDSFYPTWWLLGGLAMLAGGFALLVMRMPSHRDPDDDDDGARV